jgi:hypothetical protein
VIARCHDGRNETSLHLASGAQIADPVCGLDHGRAGDVRHQRDVGERSP